MKEWWGVTDKSFPKEKITPGIVLHLLLFCCLIQLGSVFGARWAWCRINTRLFVGHNIRAKNRDYWWLFHLGESWRNLLHVLVEVDRLGGGQDLQSSPAGKLLQSEVWYLTNYRYEQTSKVQNKVSIQKKLRDYLGIFPSMGGVFPIPKTFVILPWP